MEADRLKIGSGYALICLIWGSTWLAIRIGLNSLSPMIAGGLRFTLASIFVLIFMKYKKISLQTDPLSLKLYFILSFFSFVIPFWLVYWAEQYIPSGLTSIIFAVLPFFVILFSRIAIPKNKITFDQLVGVTLGFAGIIIIFSENIRIDLSNDILGIIAVLISSIMQAGIAVIMKKHGGHLNPLSMNFFPLLIAGISMIILAFIFETPSRWIFDEGAIGSVIYLSFIGTLIAFTVYYWLLKRINVVVLSLNSFITPIIAVILGWVFLNETLSIYALIGSSFVLIGILFANFSGLRNYYIAKNRLLTK